MLRKTQNLALNYNNQTRDLIALSDNQQIDSLFKILEIKRTKLFYLLLKTTRTQQNNQDIPFARSLRPSHHHHNLIITPLPIILIPLPSLNSNIACHHHGKTTTRPTYSSCGVRLFSLDCSLLFATQRQSQTEHVHHCLQRLVASFHFTPRHSQQLDSVIGCNTDFGWWRADLDRSSTRLR